MARFQLTQRIARSLGGSWASCFTFYVHRHARRRVTSATWSSSVSAVMLISRPQTLPRLTTSSFQFAPSTIWHKVRAGPVAGTLATCRWCFIIFLRGFLNWIFILSIQNAMFYVYTLCHRPSNRWGRMRHYVFGLSVRLCVHACSDAFSERFAVDMFFVYYFYAVFFSFKSLLWLLPTNAVETSVSGFNPNGNFDMPIFIKCPVNRIKVQKFWISYFWISTVLLNLCCLL